MISFILLALLNGLCIGASRAINGRLGSHIGAFPTSWWNHAVGFALLSALLLLTPGSTPALLETLHSAPLLSYAGGVIGVLFVALNSHVLPRIGTTRTAVLVISGQMVTGVLLDFHGQWHTSTLAQLAGVALIVAGIYLSRRPVKPAASLATR